MARTPGAQTAARSTFVAHASLHQEKPMTRHPATHHRARLQLPRALPSALALVLALAFGCIGMGAQAQKVAAASLEPLTRVQVKMERDEFLKTHRWDEPTDMWMLRAGVEPPVGVMSRADVKSARDTFLSNNRWDESRGGWVPLRTAPRVLSNLSREQVRLETRQFLRTHRWDEATSVWTEKTPARANRTVTRTTK
jgi:hypothetical protein